MAGNLTLKLKLEANEKAATTALKSAQRETQLLSKEAKAASARATAMGKAYTTSASQSIVGIQKMQQGMSNLRTQMLAFVAAGSAFELGGNIIQQADAYKQLESRIRLVTDSEEQLKEVQGLLMDQAQDNRVEIGAVTQLYAGVTPVLKEMGKSQEDILTISDSVAKSLQIGGATANQSSAAILQLTQAFASGVLRGDEFNSLMENAPALMKSLADALGLPVGSLRGLAEQGKLTSDILANSLISQNDELAASYAKIEVTVGSAMTMVKNSIGQYIGETDKALGFTAALSSGLQALAGDLSLAGSAAAALGSIGLARIVAASATAEKGMINQIKTRRAQAAAAVQSAAIEAKAEQALNQVKAQASVQDARNARRKEIAALQSLRKAKADHTEAKAALATAQANAVSADSAHVAALANERYAASLAKLKAAQVAATQASGTMATARKTEAAATALAAKTTVAAATKTSVAMTAMTAASGAASVAARGLSTALMLVGGPLGAALLAGVAIYTYRQELIDVISYSDDAEKATDKHREAMETAKDIAYKYAEATEEVKKKLEAQRDAELQAGDAQLQSAEATLKAAKIKLDAAKAKAEWHKSTGAENDVEGYAHTQTDTEELGYDRANASYEAAIANLKEIRKEYKLMGKTVKELNTVYEERGKDKPGKAQAINKEAAALDALVKKQGEALKAALKALRAKDASSKTDKLKEAQESELKKLQDTYNQLTQNEQAYYRTSLGLKDFEAKTIKAASALKYKADLLREQQALDAQELSQNTSITATYEADLRKKGFKEDDIAELADRKIKIEFEAEYKELRETQNQLALTDEMYRRATLSAKGYSDEQVDDIVIQQNANYVLAQQGELLREEIALRPKLTAQYEIDLKEKGVDQRTIDVLANEKIRLSFEALKKGLNEANQELDLGAVAYQRITLKALGYTKTQIDQIQALEAKKKVTAAIKSVEESLKSDERALSSKITAELEFELTEAGVDSDTIKKLASDKIGLAFRSMEKDLKASNQQLALGDEAFRALELSAQGFNDKQIKVIQNLEKTGEATAAIKSIEESLADTERGLSQKITAELEFELIESGVDPLKVKEIATKKLGLAFKELSQELDQNNQQINAGAVAYRGIELAAKGYNEKQIKILQDKALRNAFDAEMKSLKESSVALRQNSFEKYEAAQRAKGLTGELLKQVTAQNYANKLEEERSALQKSGATIGQSKAAGYEAAYIDKGFSEDDAKSLAMEKVGQDFERSKQALIDNRNEILMTTEAYRELGLTMDEGFTSKQAAFIAGFEKQNTQLAAWKGFAMDAFDSVGDNLTSLVMTGEADWKGMIKSMIQSAFELAVIKPLIDSLKNSFSGFMKGASGGGGGIGGLLSNFKFFAQGGAFNDANEIQYFASGGSFTNQVVNTPTLFGMSGGLGVMGEAGPEAIVPLSQMGSGNLGVEMNLSGLPPFAINFAPNITVQPAPVALVQSSIAAPELMGPEKAMASVMPEVIVNLYEDASRAGRVEQRRDDQGRQSIDVFVADIRMGGKGARAMEATYGLKRKGV